MAEETERAIGLEEFNAFVEELNYPLYVVTTATETERSGCLVGFTTQVSLEPPRMLVCISKSNRTHGVAREAGYIALHLLAPAQRDLARIFGELTGDDVDKFTHCSWHSGPGGVPVLDAAPRHVVGRIVDRFDFVDHTGHLLEPVQVSTGPDQVAFTLRHAADLEPGHPA